MCLQLLKSLKDTNISHAKFKLSNLVKESVLELQIDLCDDVSVKIEDEWPWLDWL